MNKAKAFSFQLDHDDTAATLRSPSSITIFTLLVGLFIGARLWGLTASCPWFDEIFSVHAARHDWSRLLGFVAADIDTDFYEQGPPFKTLKDRGYEVR